MAQQFVNWLVTRLQWVYSFIVRDLGLPSLIGYIVILFLIGLFFYELVDIYRHRHRGSTAFIWLLIVLFVPLGTLAYLIFGISMVRDTSPVKSDTLSKGAPRSTQMRTQKRAATTLGSVVGGLALASGAVVLTGFVFVVIAYIQCMNDTKCM